MGARPRTQDDFFARLRAEMEMRARLLTAGNRRTKAGQMTADDLVQEATAKLLSTYDEASLRERPHNQLMGLAYRTMKNLVIDQGRRKGAYLDDRDDDGPGRIIEDTAPTPDAVAAQSERAVALKAALETLEPQERAFLACVMETDSVPAAQEQCGWPPKSPYYVLKQLLARLRGELKHLESPAGGG